MSTYPLRFHRDRQGAVLAEWTGEDPAGSMLAHFFDADLAGDQSFCDRLLAEGEARLKAKTGCWRTSGNAFALTLDASRATLRPLFGNYEQDEFVLPTRQLLQLVRKWRRLIA